MRFIPLLFLTFFAFQTSQAQILDDSTKQVYGPKSVSYILEKDVQKNYATEYHPDTTLNLFFKSDILVKENWLHQDLGNIGSASQPILFKENTDPATKLGYNSFLLYAPNTSDFKYYNTRSPFTNLFYMQGSGGHLRLDFTHSQNINKRLNLTLNLSKYNSSKQIDATTSEEKLIDHWNYDISTNYFSKNKKYALLATFYHFNHTQNEQGGILKKENLSIDIDDLKSNYRKFYESEYTKGVYNTERWNNFHLYQQFVLKNGFQTFHILDYEHQKHVYVDPDFKTNSLQSSYNIPASPNSIDTLYQNFTFKTLSNKFGIKGRYKGFNYLLNARQRFYQLNNKYSKIYKTNLKSEVFLGGSLGYYFVDSSNFLNTDAEFSPDFKNILLTSKLSYKEFEGTFYQSIVPVGLFYNTFDFDVISWNNNFRGISTTYLNAKYKFIFKNFEFQPEIANTILGNYVYIDQNLKPIQRDTLSPINITNVTLNLSYNRKYFRISNQFVFNINTAKDIYKLPKVINYTNIESDILYAKVLRLNVGLDIFYKSKYTADAYSPILNHFYLQDNFNVWGVATVDPYVSFHINKVRLALKLGHANQGLKKHGFYTTPYYLAMPRNFLLKVDWPLFD